MRDFHLLMDAYDNGLVSNENFLDELCNYVQYMDEINEYDVNTRNKYIKILSKITPEANPKYSIVYLGLAKLRDLWKIVSHHDMTLLSYMSYGYDSSFYDCLYELTKYPDLWGIPEKQQMYTPLHFLIFSIRDHYKFEALMLLEKLSIYPNIWINKTKTDSTPLHEICQFREKVPYEIYKNLAKYEYLWMMQNNFKMSPLHYLCTTRDINNALETFKDLSRFEKIWSVQDEFLYTPLHIMCRHIRNNVYNDFFQFMKGYQNLCKISNKNGITVNDIYLQLDKNDAEI